MHSIVLFASVVFLIYVLAATFGHYLPFKTTREAHEHLINLLHKKTLENPGIILLTLAVEFIVVLAFVKINWMDIAGVLVAAAICIEISTWMSKDMYIDLS